MSVTFSHSFGDHHHHHHQHPTYLGRAGGLPYGLSASCAHLEDHHLSSSSSSSSSPHHHHHRPTAASDSLASAVPFILYPSGMDPSAALGLYEGGGGGGGPFRGGGGPHHHHHHHHSLLPYLSPFHHHHAAAAAAAAGRFGVYECPFEPAFIQKRNERERQRVKCVNQGYARLRQHLPGGGGGGGGEKRLSKVETLRAAIRYIAYLQGLVDGTGGEGEGPRGEEGRAGLRVETVGRDGGGGGEESPPPGSALYSSSSSSPSSSPGGESQSSGC